MRIKNISASLILITFCTGCASLTTPKTPDFYPNHKFLDSSVPVRQEDMNSCLALANEYVKDPNRYQSMAKEAGLGGVIGAATGAVGGAITGNAAAGTGAGAAVGAMLGIVKGLYDLNEHSPSYERFTEHCLQKKGYEIIGWSSK